MTRARAVRPILRFFSATGEAGEYTVEELDSKSQPTASGTFVINAGHPLESNLAVNPDLRDTFARPRPVGKRIDPGTPGRSLAALAALALGLLAFEWLWTNMGAGMGRRPGLTRGSRS